MYLVFSFSLQHNIKHRMRTARNKTFEEGNRNLRIFSKVSFSIFFKTNQALVRLICFECFHSLDLISNSPYCLSYNSYDVSLENLVLDQPTVPLIFFSVLISCLFDINNKQLMIIVHENTSNLPSVATVQHIKYSFNFFIFSENTDPEKE